MAAPPYFLLICAFVVLAYRLARGRVVNRPQDFLRPSVALVYVLALGAVVAKAAA